MAARDFTTNPLTSTTLEGAFLEVATLLNKEEVSNLDSPNNIQLQVNTDNGVVSITANIPVSFGTTSSGELQVTSTEYIGV